MQQLMNQQKLQFESGLTLSLEWRLTQLSLLTQLITENETEILEALNLDLGKPSFEAFMSEIATLLDDLKLAKNKLKTWMKPLDVSTPISMWPSKSQVLSVPHGRCLIFAPFNYPFQLALSPIIGAFSAGNVVSLKPSELTPKTEALLARLVPRYFDARNFAVFTGGPEISEKLLDQKFDFIFFTGSSKVGKIVMKKASENLTPVCLELGGKSPAIVDETADIDLAAKKIIWGKFFNAGQTCIAPDYVLVHRSIRLQLVERMNHYLKSFFSDRPESNGNYGKIVSTSHIERLARMIGLDPTPYKETRYFPPTLIEISSFDHATMKEEIFGPILPILEFSEFEDGLDSIRRLDRPLALYLFTKDENRQNVVFNEVSFGGGCVNDCLLHFAQHNLPFGGAGHSGIGNYHGVYSFKTFSQQKAMVVSPHQFDMPFRYPPYKLSTLNLIRRWLYGLKKPLS